MGVFDYGIFDRIAYLRIVVVCAMDGLHAIFNLRRAALQSVCPYSESCKVCSDTRHFECNRLKWGIAPWLIVLRIDRQVFADDDIVVCHVEDTVVACQVAWYEHNLHFVLFAIPYVVIF